MILDIIQNANRYKVLQPNLELVFQFIRKNKIDVMETGTYKIGNDVECIITIKKGKTKEEAKLEFHRKHIDVHYVINGNEIIGWKSRNDCTQLELGYDESKDFGIYADKPKNWFLLHPGTFAIFFPEDSHAPMVSDDFVHKAVFKIKI